MKEFTSQVCTDIHQSKRLLEMGLKPETADMYIFDDEVYIGKPNVDDIPAWSLHRLMEIAIKGNKTFGLDITTKNNIDYCYDRLICDIERLINVKAFNKEYLKL